MSDNNENGTGLKPILVYKTALSAENEEKV